MSPNTLVGLLMFAGLFVWLFWPGITAAWTSIKSRWGSSSDVVAGVNSTGLSAETLATFQAIDVLHKRFAAANCEEGLAAVQVCLHHVYYHQPGPAAAAGVTREAGRES